METEHSEVVDQAVVAYRQYWTALLQASEPLWAQLDMTITQLKCLVVLECRGTVTVGRVADVLGIGRPSASITIDQLVQLGLVARAEDHDDRRRTNVTLSEEGRSYLASLHQGDEEFMRGWFEQIDVDDLTALCQGLAALAQRMNESAG